jgi:endoglucanase
MNERTRMIQPTVMMYLTIPMAIASPVLVSCAAPDPTVQSQPSSSSVSAANPATDAESSEPTLTQSELIQQSWVAYKDRFIQPDGRVIDRGDETHPDRTVSEGQAYAMLRAVMIDDPDTFATTLQWAEENLARTTPDGDLIDTLWAWKWGQNDQGRWEILDENFATDADIDAVTALILAARRWNRPDYLDLAKVKLKDIWDLSTVSASPADTAPSLTNPPSAETAESMGADAIDGESTNGTDAARYLIPGPVDAFQPQPELIYLNPSYFAPYAFRLFAQVDPERDWLSLVDSSYELLAESSAAFSSGLPSDWITFNTTTQEFYPVQSPRLRSVYSFDAYRVWWRVALDAVWFDEPRATDYLRLHLPFLEQEWRSQQRIPARIDLQGNALVEYEATAQYGMLYAAFRVMDPAIADEIYDQKLLPTYRDGFWDNDSAYYTHNLSWFGIYPPDQVSSTWLTP